MLSRDLVDHLKLCLDMAKRDLAKIEGDYKELTQNISFLERALKQGAPDPESQAAEVAEAHVAFEPVPPPRPPSGKKRAPKYMPPYQVQNTDVEKIVLTLIDVLYEHGRPMEQSSILRAMKRHGCEIRGKVPWDCLYYRIRQNRDFFEAVRPAGGGPYHYRLTDAGVAKRESGETIAIRDGDSRVNDHPVENVANT